MNNNMTTKQLIEISDSGTVLDKEVWELMSALATHTARFEHEQLFCRQFVPIFDGTLIKNVGRGKELIPILSAFIFDMSEGHADSVSDILMAISERIDLLRKNKA